MEWSLEKKCSHGHISSMKISWIFHWRSILSYKVPRQCLFQTACWHWFPIRIHKIALEKRYEICFIVVVLKLQSLTQKKFTIHAHKTSHMMQFHCNSYLFYILANWWLICVNSYLICTFSYNLFTPQWQVYLGVALHVLFPPKKLHTNFHTIHTIQIRIKNTNKISYVFPWDRVDIHTANFHKTSQMQIIFWVNRSSGQLSFSDLWDTERRWKKVGQVNYKNRLPHLKPPATKPQLHEKLVTWRSQHIEQFMRNIRGHSTLTYFHADFHKTKSQTRLSNKQALTNTFK